MSQTPQPFAVRPPEPGERARFEAMFAAFAATGPEPCAADAPAYVWDCVTAPDHPMRLLVAAGPDGGMIGFLLYVTHPYSWSRRPVAYLLDLYVEPGQRGHGIATRLIRHLEELGRAAGWLKVYWMTQADNDAAHAVYGKLAVRSPLVRYDLHLNGYAL